VERPIRSALVSGGVLECDGRYERGREALGYRLAEPYRTRPRWIRCRDPKVAGRVARVRDAEFRTRLTLDVHKYLRGRLERVEIDAARAREAVHRSTRLAGSAAQHLAAIDLLAAGHLWFSFCAQGRVHTSVTCLPRELRAALRVGGQALVGIDVRNAQPLLLALLILQYRRAGNRLLNFRSFASPAPDPYAYSDLRLPACQPPLAPGSLSITVSNSGTEHPGGPGPKEARPGFVALSGDERLYLGLCERGRIYEHMQGRLAEVGFEVDRERVKVEFCRLYYGKNRPRQALRDEVSRAFDAAFRAEFPGVGAVVWSVKKQAGDHTCLSRLMQHYDSSLVIHAVCRRLMADHPHAPVVTVHDSIFTTAAHAGVVLGVLRDEFARVGLHPQFNVEDPGQEDPGQALGEAHKAA
jgi:hypothetical protein